MDLITQLPKTGREHDAVMMFVDKLSKYVLRTTYYVLRTTYYVLRARIRALCSYAYPCHIHRRCIPLLGQGGFLNWASQKAHHRQGSSQVACFKRRMDLQGAPSQACTHSVPHLQLLPVRVLHKVVLHKGAQGLLVLIMAINGHQSAAPAPAVHPCLRAHPPTPTPTPPKHSQASKAGPYSPFCVHVANAGPHILSMP